MFILINGSFGIGKTTAAKRLLSEVAGAVIFDPEDIGYVLRRLPAPLVGRWRQPPDYQDLALWRLLIGWGGRMAHFHAPVVVVPMAFTNLAYLEGFSATLEKTAPVRRVCLVAPLEVVRARLLARAQAEGRSGLSDFEITRSAECVGLHGTDPAYGLPVDAMQSPEAVAAAIRRVAGV